VKREEDEKLWDVLGQATQPTASPFFARNVLRKIREAQGEPSPRHWYLRWLVPAAGVAVVIIAGLALPTQVIKQQRSNPEAVALAESQDSELMADLDDLMGADESSVFEDAVTL
jgi:hypothetical protein